jgi:hypothetical protein
MKTVAFLLLAVGAITYATPVTAANPIPVDGFGTSAISLFHSSDLSVTASGSNGVDFVSFTFGTLDDQSIASVFCVCAPFNTNTSGSATINGITGPWVDFNIGNGNGHINIYDFSRSIIASADLIGFVQVTSTTERISQGDTFRQFNILSTNPVSEPGTAGSTGVILLALLVVEPFRRLRKST